MTGRVDPKRKTARYERVDGAGPRASAGIGSLPPRASFRLRN
jgi:hypothetical protein